ncbi:MAG: M20/M25/M40 family metallo-hydrolase [Deltaproteobacteria bacterium]|jgi:acetylornithine deacetylase/succinyl-diaminopimelate desuccinylase-like protein|nr:M20/M25/M40 family metallo-hydrolase [Deltaproteobacteria bacterium]
MAAASVTSSIHQRPAELLQRLIRFDTTNPPGNEAECINFINALLTGAGIKTTILARAPERPNLIARMAGHGSAPPLLLYGHVDVVTTENQQWQHPPFEGKIVDDFVWGRGALDMKGGVAMMLAAVLRAKVEGAQLPGDVVLAIVSDEENLGGYGAGFLVENHADVFAGIRYAIGEFGGFSFYVGRKKFYPIMIAEKQVCWLNATVRGPAGHGSLPARGGAMAKLAGLLGRLDQKRLPVHITPAARLMFKNMATALGGLNGLILGQLLTPALTNIVLNVLGEKGRVFDPLLHNTVNATVLHGGDKINVIPGRVSVELDGRLLPGYEPDDMMAELRQIIDHDVELEVMQYDPGPAEPDMGLFDKLAGILKEFDPEGTPIPLLLSGTSDARFFSKLGIQTYGFLPMPLPQDFNFSQTIHAADERVPVDALDFGTKAIYELLKRFE